MERLSEILDEFEEAFEVVPLGRHAEVLATVPNLSLRQPRFSSIRRTNSWACGTSAASQKGDYR